MPSDLTRGIFRQLPIIAAVAAGLLLTGYALGLSPSSAETAHAIPAPAMDLDAGAGSTAVAVFAGGCFWGVQGVFQHVAGVTKAVSGYAGGEKATATYPQVGTGKTGHAESVKVTYDPRKVSYGKLLQIFFSVAHDPTQLNRQGPDRGVEYRSAIFPVNAEQEKVAAAYIAQLDQAHVFKAPVVTKIETGRSFYPAEDYHQDFLFRNPHYPYIVINDLPKIEDLKRIFPDAYRPDPVLVASAGIN
jgi:peptide-methionine (S)-S-oxide reductase